MLIQRLYDLPMGKSIQIAFMLPAALVDEIDELVPGEYRSRADALRHAVAALLEQRRRASIDAALERGYDAAPQAAPEAQWADLSLEGLAGADLDW